MKLSHSKLSAILDCPASYYLNYVKGINLKDKPAALSIGSAVHYGIEHNTYNLDSYYKEGNFNQSQEYSDGQILAEAMVYGYIYHKKEIFEKLLKELDSDKEIECLDEIHEITIDSPLKSYNYEDHSFLGIIDLLILTDKGFIVIDYKTSSTIPEWDKYLDQIYRYIYLLNKNFPDTPIYKIGIINIRKTRIKQKKDETKEAYAKRLRMEYEINDNELINYHEYDPSKLDKDVISNYIKNLSYQADAAQMIEKSKCFYINYQNADGIYGKSPYYDIFYHIPDCYIKYNIKDTIFDKESNSLKQVRDCLPVDMEVLDKKVLDKYEDYEKIYKELKSRRKNLTKESLHKYILKNYESDTSLLDDYWETLQYTLCFNKTN